MDLLYPKDSLPCGYSAETGGKVANIRGLTVDKVRRYHSEYYSPDNALILLSGNVQKEDFFAALDEVEALILKRRQITPVITTTMTRVGRPWITSPIPSMIADGRVGVYPPFHTVCSDDVTVESPRPKTISFPSEDESRGTISIGWRGPTYASRATWMHISLMWDYLTESAASPLQLAFVENDDPLCADIGPAHDVFTEGYHQLWFQEVDVDRMNEVVDLFYEVMSMQAGMVAPDTPVTDGSSDNNFDLSRMRIVIRRYRRRVLEACERRPTSAITSGIIRNFLYGPRADESKNGNGSSYSPQDEMEALHADVDYLPFVDEAMLKDATFWQSLMREYILER